MNSIDNATKLCRYKLSDKCIRIGQDKDFSGRYCKQCVITKNENYYASHKEDLLNRSNSKYEHKSESYRTNPIFQNGIIYYMYSEIDNGAYIGSTCQTDVKRFIEHQNYSATKPHRKVYAHFNRIGWENVGFEILEYYPCKCLRELQAREGYWIDQFEPNLNTNRPSQRILNSTRDSRLSKMSKIIDEYRNEKPIEIKIYSLNQNF